MLKETPNSKPQTFREVSIFNFQGLEKGERESDESNTSRAGACGYPADRSLSSWNIPVGMPGSRIEVDVHVIQGSLNRLQNAIRTVHGLAVGG
jgi:hypothetical protein